jgi:GABA(A) receptor-associated protein
MAAKPTRYTTRNVNGSEYFRAFVQQPLQERKSVADQILKKYPDRVPVVIDKVSKTQLPDIEKHKFLVPGDITVGKFMYEIRKHIALRPDQAIFLFVNNVLPPTSSLMSAIYNTHKNEDNFLYITYAGENVFG